MPPCDSIPRPADDGVSPVQWFDVELPSLAQHLALDELLLDACDRTGFGHATLRLWETAETAVVVGRSSTIEDEVRVEACQTEGVPILRRISGGAAVVAGPGCLMISLVFDLRREPRLRLAEAAHQHVLGTTASALRPLAGDVTRRGISDLAARDADGVWRKVSGNSVRIKRNALLYHGTLLYGFPLEAIERLLKRAPHEPAYRGGREHGQFVMNLPLDEGGPGCWKGFRPAGENRGASRGLHKAILAAWSAVRRAGSLPIDLADVDRLATARYGCKRWNLQGRFEG